MRALKLTVVFALALSLASCTEPDARRDQSLITANSDAGDAPSLLAQLTEQESSSRRLQPLAVPPPPGVESRALLPIDDENERAALSYEKVIRHLADTYALANADFVRPAWLDDPAFDPEQAERHYVRGRDAVARKKYDEAMRELLLAHNFDAHSVTVARELARVYSNVRNRAASAEMYEHVLLLAPHDAEAVLELALYAMDRRKFEQAAMMLASFRKSGGTFEFDPAGEAIAQTTLMKALAASGYDRAVSEVGERALMLLGSRPAQGMYGMQFGIMYRQRGELWQEIGDARCRLSKFNDALAAYEQAAALPSADAWALLPRQVFAMLQLGRVNGAQHMVYEHMASAMPNDVDVRDVSLCTYIATHVPEHSLLAQAVLQLHLAHADKPALVRSAAALVERGRAIQLLHAFVNERAGDFGVLQQFLDWLAREDLDAAVDLVCTIAERYPERLEAYAASLLRAASNPTPLLAALERGQQTPIRSCVLALVNERLGALGEAWSVMQRAVGEYPDSADVARLSIRLAAELKEPALLDEALAQAEHLDDADTWAARANAYRAMGNLRQAHLAATEAVTVGPENVEALLELARTQTAIALAQPVQQQARLHGWDAAQIAEDIIALKPDEERAYEILLFVFGSEGPLTNTEVVEEHTAHLAAANPASPLLRRLSLETAIRQMRFDRAIELALELYESLPTESGMLSYAISAWSAKDDLDGANAWLLQQRRDRPQDPVLLEAWARVKILRSETVDAQRELTRLLNESPRNFRAMQLLEAMYRSTGDLDRALELGEARLLTRPQGVQRELALASMFAESGHDEQAVERLEWVVENGSESSLEQLTAAIQLVDGIESPASMRDAFARMYIDRVVLDHPETSLGAYLSGLQVLRRLDQPDDDREEALLDCLVQRASLDTSTGDFAAMYWREVAQQLVDIGRVDGASEVLRARLRSDSELDAASATMLALCAVIADAAGGATPDETIALLEHTFGEGGINPRNVLPNDLTLADLMFEAGNAYTLVGDDAGAALMHRKVIELDPRHAMALNNLGYARVDAGVSDEETVAMVERAIELAPDDPNVLDTIGWLRYKQGHFEDRFDQPAPPEGEDNADANKPRRAVVRPGAVSLIRDAMLRSAIPSAEVHDHLGDALWRTGDKNAALREWNAAHDILIDEARMKELITQYAFIQRNVWRLLVLDPQSIWDREYGRKRDQVWAKINAVNKGGTPEVAPLFDESNSGEDRENDGRSQ